MGANTWGTADPSLLQASDGSKRKNKKQKTKNTGLHEHNKSKEKSPDFPHRVPPSHVYTDRKSSG